MRADIVDLRKSRDSHEAILNRDSDDLDMTDDVGASSTVNGKTTGYQISTDRRFTGDKMRRFWQQQDRTTASLIRSINDRKDRFYGVKK
jgi:hypothetical protein